MTTRQIQRRKFNPVFKRLDRRDDPMRRIGLGAPSPKLNAGLGAEAMKRGLGDIATSMKNATTCSPYNMPVIEQVRWGLGGPISFQSTQANFGAQIDLFGSGKSPQGIDFVETTMAQTGQTQTYTIVCAIGLHVETEPMIWTAQGNAWTTPTTGSVPPVSPNVFTQNDVANGALGLGDGQTLERAVLEWGWWGQQTAWHMARGYNLRWKIGQHNNIMDDVARHTMYMPPNAQEGSASSSEVDIARFVRQTNDRYEMLGTTSDFLEIDRVRTGSVSTLNAGTNIGVFRPSNDYRVVPATYGGMDLRSMLHGNSEFRKLTIPYVLKPGIPIGLILEENDQYQGDAMRQFLDITEGFESTIPPFYTDALNINAAPAPGVALPAGAELTFDQPPVLVAQSVNTATYLYKGGFFKLTLSILGFEVGEDWYTEMTQDPELKAAVMSEAGIRFMTQ